ncbi:MAG: bifunctional aldolase/short-chain dehydrogenase [Burkholderiales bacterium]|nr:bifunctional aldolase/short-chain dehydrogenase [Burkholderiales bacterium]
MKSLWNDADAATWKGELGLRVYSSRLLGRDRSLVLHGGGNTSVKLRETNLAGEEEDVLYVKGSGQDLESIEEAGFAPVRMTHLLKLARRESLTDSQMVNELLTHLTRAGAPAPSVETILHALLPHRYVDHTHADAVLAVTNTDHGEARVRRIYGSRVVVIPYVMPGFDLARLCAARFPREAREDTIGMVLMNHGVFSFGATARESYERMIELVDAAERHLATRNAWSLPSHAAGEPLAPPPTEIAALRRELSAAAGCPLVLRTEADSRALAFARRADLRELALRGPVTPDHVLRTKRVPMIGRDVAAYAREYREYFAEHVPGSREPKTMLDPAPRVVLDPQLGLCTAGRSAREAAVVADIYRHTMDVIERAALTGGYRALAPREIFEVEYWDLEQAKLRRAGRPPPLAGEVALVTGAASGIGKACVAALVARGAAVVGMDIDPAIESCRDREDFLGLRCDVTHGEEVGSALRAAVARFGGIDMLILNAGVFPGGARIGQLGLDEWRRVMAVNLDANFALMREAYPLLRLAPGSGRVVVIGSKNVPAPGPGAAAYSASKAALTQLARVAALEWGAEGIRVNVLHPNAVFDTGAWTEEVLRARAANYGVTVDEYKHGNVLGTEIRSRDVAELAAEMCGPLFSRTTGAQLPVDGGNERVI